MRSRAPEDWPLGPERPLLADSAIHLWRADLDAMDGHEALLCPGERVRAEEIAGTRKRELWRRARGLLRSLLGSYLRRDPAALRFEVGPHGKPALAGGPVLPFNVSHSGALALYAFSARGAVGVDVQLPRESMHEVATAERVLGVSVARGLEDLDPVARRREFLRAWTRREAQLKCLGVGLSPAGGPPAATGLWTIDLELAPEVAGALAAELPARELQCWECPTPWAARREGSATGS